MLSWLLVASCLVILPACGSNVLQQPITLPNHSASSGNELVSQQSRLVLPEGWQFKRSTQDNVLFTFKSSDGELEGRFHYFTVSADVAVKLNVTMKTDRERSAKIMTRVVEEVVDDPKLYPTRVDGRPGFVYRGTSKGLEVMGLLLPEGRGVNNIFVVAGQGDLDHHRSELYAIFGSYTFIKDKKVAMRRMPGIATFTNREGEWKWVGDAGMDGFFVSSQDASFLVYVGKPAGVKTEGLHRVVLEVPPSLVVGGQRLSGELHTGTKDGHPVALFTSPNGKHAFLVVADADKLEPEHAFDEGAAVPSLLAQSVSLED